MAKKTPKSSESSASSVATPAAPVKRRAPAQKKSPSQAAAPIDVATVGGTEPLTSASDTGASANAGPVAGAKSNDSGYQPSHDEIAQAAYFRHLNRGGSGGDDFDDWVEAEKELRKRRR